MNSFSIQMQNRPKSKKYYQNMHGKTIFDQFYIKNYVISHGLLNLHGRTYTFSKKKIVGQIFCFDWEEISEKMSK